MRELIADTFRGIGQRDLDERALAFHGYPPNGTARLQRYVQIRIINALERRFDSLHRILSHEIGSRSFGAAIIEAAREARKAAHTAPHGLWASGAAAIVCALSRAQHPATP